MCRGAVLTSDQLENVLGGTGDVCKLRHPLFLPRPAREVRNTAGERGHNAEGVAVLLAAFPVVFPVVLEVGC